MGFHRLYWVPPGMDPTSGVYVRYRPQEWYAALALESHRAGAAIVGEDLGTVPPVVHGEMSRHCALRTHLPPLEALTRQPASPYTRRRSAALSKTQGPP